jgi:kumamolisin
VAVTAVVFGPVAQAFAGSRARNEIDTILNTVTWPYAGRAAADPTVGAGAAPPGGLRPRHIGRAFGIEPLWSRGIRGRGQTIALVSLDTFRHEDVRAYERSVGIDNAPPVERVLVRGPVPLGAGTQEVNLDIDVIRAVAPEATIVNYEALLSWDGFSAALDRINDDGRAAIVSVSWGGCLPQVDTAVRVRMQQQLARAAAAGRTIFVASGDSGAFPCLHSGDELDPDQHLVGVDWPAASPHVVAVGGTRVALRTDSSYFAENAWVDTLSSDATGGGVSPLHARPAWQRGDGVDRSSSNGRRQVPDVAGPADCDSAFFIVYPERAGKRWIRKQGPYGCGTSAAAPFWAGVAALVQEYAAREGIDRLGFLAPTLYAVAHTDAFRDVRTGGNLLHPATRGWDYATGLGSPDAWNLARAIVAQHRSTASAR